MIKKVSKNGRKPYQLVASSILSMMNIRSAKWLARAVSPRFY